VYEGNDKRRKHDADKGSERNHGVGIHAINQGGQRATQADTDRLAIEGTMAAQPERHSGDSLQVAYGARM
jgi:hypothetical protein